MISKRDNMDNLSSSALRIVLNEHKLDGQKQAEEQLQSITSIVDGAADYYINIRLCVINMLDSKEDDKLNEFKLKHILAITELYNDIKNQGEIDSHLWNTHTNFLDILRDMKLVISSSKCKKCMRDLKNVFNHEPYDYLPFSRLSDDSEFEFDEMDETLQMNEDLDDLFENDTRDTAIKKQYHRYELKLIKWEKDAQGHISNCAALKLIGSPPKFEDYYDDDCEEWFDEKNK